MNVRRSVSPKEPEFRRRPHGNPLTPWIAIYRSTVIARTTERGEAQAAVARQSKFGFAVVKNERTGETWLRSTLHEKWTRTRDSVIRAPDTPTAPARPYWQD